MNIALFIIASLVELIVYSLVLLAANLVLRKKARLFKSFRSVLTILALLLWLPWNALVHITTDSETLSAGVHEIKEVIGFSVTSFQMAIIFVILVVIAYVIHLLRELVKNTRK